MIPFVFWYKVIEFNSVGLLDGEPWAKEMHENSKRTLEELREVFRKYNK